MPRLITGWLVVSLTAVVVLAGPEKSLRAAEAPFTGTWTTTVLLPGQDITVFLVEIKDKDGKVDASVLSAGIPNFKDAKVESAKITEDKALHLTIQAGGMSFTFVVYPPKGEAKLDKSLGSVEFSNQRHLAKLEKSDLKELDPKKVPKQDEHTADYFKAMQRKDAKGKANSLKDFLSQEIGAGLAYQARLELLGALAEGGSEADDLRKDADKTIKFAADYGPDMKLSATLEAAKKILTGEKVASLAVDYARQAEKLLDKTTSTNVQVRVLKTLQSALTKAEKSAEAKDVAARVAKLDLILDQEFMKDAVPFEPEAFKGRKGKSDRVTVVELYTGAQCPPCVAADVAFDGLLKTYKASDVILLQYHLHIPGPDPLTNGDSEKRSTYYKLQGTPTYYIDGKEGPPCGGGKGNAKEKYGNLVKAIGDRLEDAADAKLKLTAKRKGSAIDIQAAVADLKEKGDDVRLRFVLVEEIARYAGTNGQRLHHHVVRGFPGGVEGKVLKDESASEEIKVDLAELTKTLSDYLQESNKKRKFLDDDRPMELKHLKVIAFIQNDKDKVILQAAQVDLPEEK